MNESRPLGVGLTPLETRREVALRVADLAEDLGYDSMSVAEGWGHDASVLLAELATRTSRIRLGTGVLNIWGRSAGTIAMLATSLAELSGGRFDLGLGAGSPQLAEGLHDVAFRAPIERLGSVTRQVRRLLDGERIESTLAGASRPLRLSVHSSYDIPIQLAALGPVAVQLAGELADAWDPFLLPRSALKDGAGLLEEGARRSGRPLPRVCPSIPAAVSADPPRSRGLAAWWIVFYLTSMGPLYASMLRRRGFADAVDAVLAANQARGAEPQLPPEADDLIDELTVSGDGSAARADLERWYAAGADMPVVVLPPNRSLDELEHILRVLRPA